MNSCSDRVIRIFFSLFWIGCLFVNRVDYDVFVYNYNYTHSALLMLYLFLILIIPCVSSDKSNELMKCNYSSKNRCHFKGANIKAEMFFSSILSFLFFMVHNSTLHCNLMRAV